MGAGGVMVVEEGSVEALIVGAEVVVVEEKVGMEVVVKMEVVVGSG